MKRHLASRFILLCALVTAGLISSGAGPNGQPQQPLPTLAPAEVRGQDVGGGVRLWVHVFPARDNAKPGSGVALCDDLNQQQVPPPFAKAKLDGLQFDVSTAGAPADFTLALSAAMAAWNTQRSGYFTTTTPTSTAFGSPANDGQNTIGWAFLVPTRTLAAAWTWTDATGRVIGADIRFNVGQPFAALASCGGNSFDIQSVATHELGHTVGLEHVSDSLRQATLYPSAPKGETRKRTLTTGDVNGFLAGLQ